MGLRVVLLYWFFFFSFSFFDFFRVTGIIWVLKYLTLWRKHYYLPFLCAGAQHRETSCFWNSLMAGRVVPSYGWLSLLCAIFFLIMQVTELVSLDFPPSASWFKSPERVNMKQIQNMLFLDNIYTVGYFYNLSFLFCPGKKPRYYFSNRMNFTSLCLGKMPENARPLECWVTYNWWWWWP